MRMALRFPDGIEAFTPNDRTGANRHCYWNCQQLAFADSSLTYQL
jgi:hypothetical protein